MDKVKSYRDLQVWQRGLDLAVRVYKITDSFPKVEQYGLTNQMRRAAVSIPSNIAEGHRRSDAEFSRYLTIALGSLAELETQIEIANRIAYLADSDRVSVTQETDVLGRQLNTLHQRVTASRQ